MRRSQRKAWTMGSERAKVTDLPMRQDTMARLPAVRDTGRTMVLLSYPVAKV